MEQIYHRAELGSFRVLVIPCITGVKLYNTIDLSALVVYESDPQIILPGGHNRASTWGLNFRLDLI